MSISYQIKIAVKRLLHDSNETYAYCPERGMVLSKHDHDHIAVSKLAPVAICGQMVNGINGVAIKQFHDHDHVAQYDGLLDEARVALYQVCVHTCPCSVVRAAVWMARIAVWGDNPVRVLRDHCASMNVK